MSGAAGGPPRNNIGALRIQKPRICDAAEIARLKKGLHPGWTVVADPFILNNYIDEFDCTYVHLLTGERRYIRPRNLVNDPDDPVNQGPPKRAKTRGGKRTRRSRNHKRTRKIDK